MKKKSIPAENNLNFTKLNFTEKEKFYETEARELCLFAENDGDLYNRFFAPIEKNFIKKVKKNIFDPEKAIKAYYTALLTAAKKYEKYFLNPGEATKIFPADCRRAVAKMFINYFILDIENIIQEAAK